MRIAIFIVLVLGLLECGRKASASDGILLYENCRVQFASQEEGQRLLAAEDRFYRSLSRFDLESRLGKQDAAKQDWVAFSTSQVRPWSDEDRTAVTNALAEIGPLLRPYSLPFPETIRLIHTTGREEGQAAYCRENAIVLPSRQLRISGEQLRRLLLHELFHVLSNQNPQWRAEMYKIVGFRSCPAIELPPDWRDRKLTNPDAPQIDCVIDVTVDGRKVTAAPVLLASVDRYDPQEGGTFFRYLQFWLMAVEPHEQGFRAILRNGEPILHASTDAADYLSQVGENTRYIIHPDEILADNFVLLVSGEGDVRTPRILAEMKERTRRD